MLPRALFLRKPCAKRPPGSSIITMQQRAGPPFAPPSLSPQARSPKGSGPYGAGWLTPESSPTSVMAGLVPAIPML